MRRTAVLGGVVVAVAVQLWAADVTPLQDLTEFGRGWTCGAQDAQRLAEHEMLTREAVVGRQCVVLNFANYLEHYLAFPQYRDADWDLSAAEYLELRVKPQKGVEFAKRSPTLYLCNNNGSFIRIRWTGAESLLSSEGEWRTLRIPLGETEGWEQLNWLGASLKHVAFFEIAFEGGGPAGCAHHVFVDGVQFGPTPVAYETPNEDVADLDVLCVERAPLYERYTLDYHPSEANPAIEIGHVDDTIKHEPDAGEEVTFTAHVQNKGRQPSAARYEWLLDGRVVASGDAAELAPREKATFTWSWAWDAADHDLTFRLQPAQPDLCARNDALTMRTNAILLKFMVERGAVHQMESKFNMYGSRSAEDWLRGQLDYMNQLFAESKYDFAPDGIRARVAIGAIEYVDDGHIMTLGGGPYRVGETDTSYDGGRGVLAVQDPWYRFSLQDGPGAGGMNEYLNAIARADDCWLHELSHQIGVIDDYQFITESEDNFVNGVGFKYENNGLMGGGNVAPHPTLGRLYSLYAPVDVHALNVTKGKRRGYFGEYLYCMPKHNTLVLVDETGKPLSNADVNVYQTFERKIDTTPEHAGRADAKGRFELANRPADSVVTGTGCELHPNPFGPPHVVGFNGVLLIVAKQGDVERYAFLDLPAFNIAWARGDKEHAEYKVTLKPKGDERWFTPPPRSAQ